MADITVLDLSKEYDIDASKFYSMGKSTLFDGCHVSGDVVSTYVDGKKVYPFNI